MRLLVVDDDTIFAELVAKSLTRQNYAVDVAIDGQIAWEMLQSQVYDLIVLDIMLPKLDGVSLCQRLRQQGCSVPILLLTARSSSNDKVAGLDAGADDYLSKPFDWQEFLARVRALLRREVALTPAVLTWGALSLDPQTCEVHYAEKPLSLRPREYKLLELLLRNPNRVFSCGAILEHLWSFEDQPSDDTVRAHIKGLRQKLRTVEAEELIETVYGLGYRLKPLEELPLAELPLAESAEASAVQPSLNPNHELQQALASAWQEVKPELLEQVACLEEVVETIAQRPLEPKLRQKAIAEAHKLSGTVGSYGFKFGSQLAQQIESLLQSDRFFNSGEIAVLQERVIALRQELSAPPRLPPTASSHLQSLLPLANRPANRPDNTLDSARILAIDDDPHIFRILERVLEPWGLNLTGVQDVRHFWECLEKTNPNLLLLDVEMPEISGLELCEQVRNNPRWAGLPIVFLTAHTDTETVQQVFMAGADDFVTKPIVVPELINCMTTRIQHHRLWQKLAERDSLTHLTTHNKFTQDLCRLLQTASQQPVTLVLLKINQLKSINHDYGHQVGDDVLRWVGTLLNQQTAPEDLTARWSGNKFAIALHGVTGNQAIHRLSHLIQALREREFKTLDQPPLTLTVSTGLAHYPEDGRTLQALYQTAENRLAGSPL